MFRRLILVALVWAAAVLAGCGHDAGISASIPGELDPEAPQVGGAVLAPNGIYAAGESGWFRFASWFTGTAHALAPNVRPVGPGVSVTLLSVSEQDAEDGVINNAVSVSSPQPTDPTGHFAVSVLGGHEIGECGLLLSAGRGSSLTRAFVYGSDDQDVSAVGEAVVRSILNYIALHPNVLLCDYNDLDIEEITGVVDAISRDIGGSSVSDINENVYRAARDSAEVQSLLEDFSVP